MCMSVCVLVATAAIQATTRRSTNAGLAAKTSCSWQTAGYVSGIIFATGADEKKMVEFLGWGM